MNEYRIPDEIKRSSEASVPDFRLVQRCFSSTQGKKASALSLLSFISGFRMLIYQILIMALIMIGTLGWALLMFLGLLHYIAAILVINLLAGILILTLCIVSHSAHSKLQNSPTPIFRHIKRAALMAKVRGAGLLVYSLIFICLSAYSFLSVNFDETPGVPFILFFILLAGIVMLLCSAGWLACGAYHRRLYRFARTGKYKSSKRPPYFWMGVSVSFYFLTFNFFSALCLLSSMTWFKYTHREIVSSRQ